MTDNEEVMISIINIYTNILKELPVLKINKNITKDNLELHLKTNIKNISIIAYTHDLNYGLYVYLINKFNKYKYGNDKQLYIGNNLYEFEIIKCISNYDKLGHYDLEKSKSVHISKYIKTYILHQNDPNIFNDLMTSLITHKCISMIDVISKYCNIDKYLKHKPKYSDRITGNKLLKYLYIPEINQ